MQVSAAEQVSQSKNDISLILHHSTAPNYLKTATVSILRIVLQLHTSSLSSDRSLASSSGIQVTDDAI